METKDFLESLFFPNRIIIYAQDKPQVYKSAANMVRARGGVRKGTGDSVSHATRGGLLGEPLCELKLKKRNFLSGGGWIPREVRAMPSSLSGGLNPCIPRISSLL